MRHPILLSESSSPEKFGKIAVSCRVGLGGILPPCHSPSGCSPDEESAHQAGLGDGPVYHSGVWLLSDP